MERAAVFISCEGQAAEAEALHAALSRRGVSAFLDAEGVGPGQSMADGALYAPLWSRVLVALVDGAYATQRSCAEELSTALLARRTLRARGARPAEVEESLLPVVVGVGADGLVPPELADQEWPRADRTEELAGLVVRRLSRVPDDATFGGQHGRVVELLAPAMPAFRRVMGPRHETTIGALFALGSAQQMQGEWAAALRSMEEAHESALAGGARPIS